MANSIQFSTKEECLEYGIPLPSGCTPTPTSGYYFMPTKWCTPNGVLTREQLYCKHYPLSFDRSQIVDEKGMVIPKPTKPAPLNTRGAADKINNWKGGYKRTRRQRRRYRKTRRRQHAK
jgi:hypothetical protein